MFMINKYRIYNNWKSKNKHNCINYLIVKVWQHIKKEIKNSILNWIRKCLEVDKYEEKKLVFIKNLNFLIGIEIKFLGKVNNTQHRENNK